MKIRVSRHAIEQFKRRIIMNDLLDELKMISQIKSLFIEAKYISDNANGILFRNDDLMIEFIVKNNKIITLFPIIKKGE